MLDPKQLILYGITDRSWMPVHEDYHENLQVIASQVEQAIQGGVTMIQMREKNIPYQEMKEEAYLLKTICRTHQIPFLINDYVDLAKEVGVDGVHVGQSDRSVSEARNILGKNAIIGATAKTVEQAIEAQKQGADYLGSGAVFGSTTKKDAKPMNHDVLEQIVKAVSIPVVAIGGINGDNILMLANRGISGVAVIGGIFGKPDIYSAARELREKVRFI